MKKQQHAATFASRYYDPHGSKEDQKLWKVVMNAVLHGIEIGYDMGFRDGLPPVEEEQDAESLAKIKAAVGPHVHLSKPMRGGFAEEL